jgi:ABC-type antimicrobial peptide transport system permease subunit
MTTKIAIRKIRKERMWSLAIVGLLTIGLTTWMVVPSLSASLQKGLTSYSNSVATYIFVYNTGEDYKSRLPAKVTDQIAAIAGVQEVYPIVANWTYFIGLNIDMILANGTRLNMTGSIGGHYSAVIGGQGGFPQALISLSAGRLPENGEAGFIVNGLANSTLRMNQTYVAAFEEPSQNRTPNVNTYVDDWGREYVRFNATAVGQMPYNPMFQQVGVLWNSNFLRQKLGVQLYDETFGGEGPNYFIVKAEGIGQVEQVADNLQAIFTDLSTDYPGYSVIYDQATVQAQLSFQSGSAVLYELIGITSLLSVTSLVFLIIYVFSGRRSWEAGLLITQGWNWRKITKLFFNYYLLLGILAVAISAPLSVLIARQVGYSFQVYGNTLVIPILISPYTLVSCLVISLLVSTVAAYFAVWRMKKMGLDNLLREY